MYSFCLMGHLGSLETLIYLSFFLCGEALIAMAFPCLNKPAGLRSSSMACTQYAVLLNLSPFFQFVLVLLIGLFTLCIWSFIHRWSLRNHRGPPSWPLIGAVLDLASHAADFHDYVTDYCRKYRTFKVLRPGADYVFTAEPATVEYMLKTNFSNFVKGNVAHERQKELLGDGIFNVDGNEWKEQRKVASLEFSSKSLRVYSEDTFRNCAWKLARLIVCETKSKGQIELQDLTMRMTFESICKIAFGMEMGSLEENRPVEQQAFSTAFDSTSENMFWRHMDPFWKLKKWLGVGSERQLARAVQILDKFVFNFIQRRKRELDEQYGGAVHAGRQDLLSRFLALNEIHSGKYSDRKIRDITINFVIAGRDTIAITLCWFFYELSQNPQVEEKLVEEILSLETEKAMATEHEEFSSDERIQQFAESLTYEKLNEMNYLQACLSETLRLHPPVPLDAKSVATLDKLPDGTSVKKGDFVHFTPYAMGRMEWIWGEDAHVFNPERFLKDGVYHQESPFKLTAFQAGPRICLGKDFAYLQMKVTVALLLRFFKFRLIPGHHKVSYRVMLNLNMSREGLKLHVLPR